MKDYRSWYEASYASLSGGGVWLRGHAPNTLAPSQYDQRSLHVLIARLSTARDTATSFSHSLLYQIAADTEGVYPDLAWLPPPRDAELMSESGVPWLLGSATKYGPTGFDLVALSNAVLLELLSLPAILARSGIALGKSERLDSPHTPLLVLGGANALHCSSLFAPDPLVDLVFVGDDPAAIATLFAVCREAKSEGLSKRQAIERLLSIPGVFEPDGSRVTTAAVSHTPVALTHAPLSLEPDRGGKGHVQISDGCPWFCGFCAESWSRKPYRERAPHEILEAALAMKQHMGVHDCELFSFNFSAHSRFPEILTSLRELFPVVGLKSQRFDRIASNPGFLNTLHGAGKSSITCGLEGVSARLRRYLQKGLETSVIESALRTLLNAKIREVKIFLIATGREEQADWEEFKSLLRMMSVTCRKKGRGPRVIFSMTPLVRFSWTPQEFEDASPPQVVREAMLQAQRIVNGHGFEFRRAATDGEYLVSQILARADDPRIAEALIGLYHTTGFVYYDTVPEAIVETFSRLVAERGLSVDELLRGSDPALPRSWSAITPGAGRSFLIHQYRAVREGKDSGPCTAGPAADPCKGCGACGKERPSRPAISLSAPPHASTPPVTLTLAVETAEPTRGLDSSIVAAALARALMIAEPHLTRGYRGAAEGYLQRRYGLSWIFGDDRFAFDWEPRAAELLAARLTDAAFCAAVNRALEGWATVKGPAPHEEPIVQLHISSPFAFEPTRFCRDHHLKYTAVKETVGFRFCLTPDSIKRKVLASMRTIRNESQTTAIIEPARRFVLREFLDSAFSFDKPGEWMRMKVRAQFTTSTSPTSAV